MSKAEKRSRRKLPPMEVGQRYGRLTSIRLVERKPRGHDRWLFSCQCGNEAVAIASNVRSGKTKSCGCFEKLNRYRHSMCGTREYETWQSMHNRCRNPSHASYKNYGAKGIGVCKRWSSFENFFADMGIRPKGKSLDRIDGKLNYSPDNCKWSTRSEQNSNTSRKRLVTYRGMSMSLVAAAELAGLAISGVRHRLRRGCSDAEALLEVERHCAHCGQSLRGKRIDAKICSQSCYEKIKWRQECSTRQTTGS